MTHRERRSYDYRIKAQVVATGNPNLFPELEIPRSTASSWLHRGLGDVVVLDAGAAAALRRIRQFIVR